MRHLPLTWVACRQGVSVLVTASHLIAALGKLLLYDLDSFFHTDRVFSACAVSKTDLFARLVNTHLNEHGHTRYVRFMICASVSRASALAALASLAARGSRGFGRTATPESLS